ncbi:hypothetical protein Tco_1244227 [Tanacetum coccineum]
MASNEETNAAGTDTRPPMLVESDYDSWKIRIHRYIRGKPLGKLIWNSIQNGPSPHPMITDAPTEDQTGVNMKNEKLDSGQTLLKRFGIMWVMLMHGSGRKLQQRKKDLFDGVILQLEDTLLTVHDEPNCYEKPVQRELQEMLEIQVERQSSYGNVTLLQTGKKVNMFIMLRGSKGIKGKKGATLDAEAEAFLANVECTTPYDQPLAMTTTNIFEVNHEDAYDSDVDGMAPMLACSFMAITLSSYKWKQMVANHQSKKMSEVQVVPNELWLNEGKPGHVRPASGFYEKLNAMMFVPQKELSQEQTLDRIQLQDMIHSLRIQLEMALRSKTILELAIMCLKRALGYSSLPARVAICEGEFPDCKLCDPQSGSKGISGSTNCSLVFGLRMLTAYDRRSCATYQLCRKVHCFTSLLAYKSSHSSKSLVMASSVGSSEFGTLITNWLEIDLNELSKDGPNLLWKLLVLCSALRMLFAVLMAELEERIPNLQYLRVLDPCDIYYDTDDVGNLIKANADIGILLAMCTHQEGVRFYNNTNEHVPENVHVTFDELTGQD